MIKKLLISTFAVLFVFLICIFIAPANFKVAYADLPNPMEYTMTEVVNGQTFTDDDTITLNSVEEFRAFASYVNDVATNSLMCAYFKLTTDIELNENSNDFQNWEFTAPANSWTPIGTNSSTPFKGIFFGQGHTVSGVYINSTENYQGLFGYNDGSILDVGSVNFFIKGGSTVGGLAAYNRRDLIDCYTKGIVCSDSTGESDSLGGITGSNSREESVILNCYNLSTVRSNVPGDSCIGGIAGSNLGSIANCYHAGYIAGYIAGNSANIGSIVGSGTGDSVSACYWLDGRGANTIGTTDNFDENGIIQTANNNGTSGITVTAGETTLREALNSYVDAYYDFYADTDEEPVIKYWVSAPFPVLPGVRTISFVENNGTYESEYEKPTEFLEGTVVNLPTSAQITRLGYTFNGWTALEGEWNETTNPYITSITINDTGNKTFYAKWTINKFTVVWKNGDVALETDENVEYGTFPTYDGATPTKDSDKKYTYSFNGWSPNIENVSDNVTYTAQFSAVPIEKNNLVWLWILLGVVGGALIVLLLLWIFVFKRSVKFILNGQLVETAKYKLNEELIFPESLAKFTWLADQEQTKIILKHKMGLFGFSVYCNNENDQNTEKVD